MQAKEGGAVAFVEITPLDSPSLYSKLSLR